MAVKLLNSGYTLVNKSLVFFKLHLICRFLFHTVVTYKISLPVSALRLGQASVMCSQSKQAVITHRKWLNYSGKAFSTAWERNICYA